MAVPQTDREFVNKPSLWVVTLPDSRTARHRQTYPVCRSLATQAYIPTSNPSRQRWASRILGRIAAVEASVMQYLHCGINSLSKFAIARRLLLLRGIVRHIIFPVPSLRPVPRHLSPPSDCARLRFGPQADHARVINAFTALYCVA